MILVIDNYDSFVYNIARYFECAGAETIVARNDTVTAAEVGKMKPAAIVISPGPCTPQEAGISVELIKKLGAYTPVFGICLGHQCIGEAYGAKTIRAARPMHGMASEITNTGEDIFLGLPKTISVGRYHSLVTELQPGSPLEVTARGPRNEIMAMRHKTHPVYGVQFHPESILTPEGAHMVENFTAIARHWQKRRMAA